jgi:hypothetical protein
MSHNSFCHDDDKQSYFILFDVETYLRTLVRWEIRAMAPFSWKGLIPEEITQSVKKRQIQEKELCYLDIRESGFLSYVTLSELKDILIGPLWTNIKTDWPPLDVLKAEFKKLIAIRNKVAHFRPVTLRDMRIAKRFAEDLEEWTKHYSSQRAYASSLDKENICMNEKSFLDKFIDLKSFWNDCFSKGFIEVNNLVCKKFKSHLYLEASVTGGSINHAAFTEFITKYERTISFCRVGKLGEKLGVYIPLDVTEKDICIIFQEVLELIDKEVEGFSSEEVRGKFSFASREGVLPWEFDLPINFIATTF